MTDILVSVEWLKRNLKDDKLIVLDASPKTNVSDINSSFDNKVIPFSRCFKIKENFSNKKSKFPNTFPSEQQFQRECRNLGINKSSKIVVYDNLGIYTSPRVWWMFKAMGYDNISVLNGGLPAWIKKGFGTEQKEEKNYIKGNFEAYFQVDKVKLYKDVLTNVSSKECLLIDARSSGRFNGIEKEPRKNIKSGHIANSINIPYQNVLKNGKYKSVEDLRIIFERYIISNQELIFSCGSGITACIILLASELTFKNRKCVYDGSWTEWAELQNLKEEL